MSDGQNDACHIIYEIRITRQYIKSDPASRRRKPSVIMEEMGFYHWAPLVVQSLCIRDTPFGIL